MPQRDARKGLGRWSQITDLPEWIAWMHLGLAGALAVALAWNLRLPLGVAIAIWLGGALLLTLGLRWRSTAIATAVLGTVFATVTSACTVGVLLTHFSQRLLSGAIGTYVSLALGGILGAWLAIERYRPFVSGVRAHRADD
ncbi:MAG: hypothetical protein JNL79_16825 [Myxococcales bacterium]|nr:hypothetical protein [Myxococcales bacterium]